MPSIEAIADLFGIDDDDDEEDDDNMAQWIPDECMLLVTGLRGGCKSLFIAYLGLRALMGMWNIGPANPIPVHSDLDYKHDGLEQYGVRDMPIPLDYDKLITFKLDIPGAMIQIDEATAKLDKLRTNTNQNMLASNMWQQLRKMCLKIVLGCQFGNYLPYGTLDQVDLVFYCQDAYYSVGGREAGLDKGTVPIITVTDKSGYFTGGRARPWSFTIPGRDMWDIYRTDKIHDPTQFAQKYEIKREKITVGDDEEAPNTSYQRDLQQNRETISELWGSQLMGFIIDNAERLDMVDNGQAIKVSKHKLEKALGEYKGDAKTEMKNNYISLLVQADKGEVVSRRNNMLEILKAEVFSEGDDVVNHETIGTPGDIELNCAKI